LPTEFLAVFPAGRQASAKVRTFATFMENPLSRWLRPRGTSAANQISALRPPVPVTTRSPTDRSVCIYVPAERASDDYLEASAMQLTQILTAIGS